VEAPTADLLDQLTYGGVDTAFVRPDRANPSGMKIKEIGAEPTVVVLLAAYRLARIPAVQEESPQDLSMSVDGPGRRA
jgi:DNA-binding transcriptional LysR family regulator